MQAIWIGAETELMDTVLLSLQSRWPDAQITASQVAAQIVEWTEQDEYEVVFVYLGSEGANEALACVRAIRNVSEIPILAVAEESSGLDRVKALYMGCDSVITADSGPIEIQAHTMAVLRRVRGRQPELESPIQLGEIQISPATHEVYVRGQRVNLTPTEFRLIHALVRRQGSVATHDSGEVITSWPGPTPARRNPTSSAAVPEQNARTARPPQCRCSAASNSRT